MTMIDKADSLRVSPKLEELNERSREIFQMIIDSYVETGEPVGSRTLSRWLTSKLSPASIRNVMADLEEAGLLYSPHISAGRLPTEAGLRLFVDALMSAGDLSTAEKDSLAAECRAQGRSVDDALDRAGQMLSGLSHCASLVVVPTKEAQLRHIEIVPLSEGQALVVAVTVGGMVENRLISIPTGLPPSSLVMASNYLNNKLRGRSVSEARQEIEQELSNNRAQLDQLSAQVVEAGLANWVNDGKSSRLIVRGGANLLSDVTAVEDIDRIRGLLDLLDRQEMMIRLIDMVEVADGVRVFIGSENSLFNMTGCSMIVAPYAANGDKVVGAVGVIGPTRLNYAKIVPMVDYTARLIQKMVAG